MALLTALIHHMGIPTDHNAESDEENMNPNWNAIHDIILSRKNAETLFDVTLLQMSLQIKVNPIPTHVLCAILEKNDYVTRNVLLPESTFRLACENSETSPNIMKGLLDAQERILTLEHVIAWDLINISAKFGNFEATRVLIDRFPGALFACNERQEIPLHEACSSAKPEMVKLLITEGEKYQVGGPGCVGGLYVPNYGMVTPFKIALDMISHHDHDAKAWDIVEICFQSAYMARIDQSMHRHIDVPMLHAAIALAPVSSLALFIKRYQVNPSVVDCYGRNALVAAIHSTRNYRQSSLKNIFYMLLEDQYGGRQCAAMKHGTESKLPLHIAIDSGLEWNNGLEEIMKANYTALVQRENHEGLFPFMSAACNGDLTSSFLMLQNNPTLIFDSVGQNRKRKALDTHDIKHSTCPPKCNAVIF